MPFTHWSLTGYAFNLLIFGGCVYIHISIPLAIIVKKRSPKTFGIKTKCPLYFSHESKATLCLRTFDRTHKGR